MLKRFKSKIKTELFHASSLSHKGWFSIMIALLIMALYMFLDSDFITMMITSISYNKKKGIMAKDTLQAVICKRQSSVTTADIIVTFMKAHAPLSVIQFCPTNGLHIHQTIT